MQTQIERGRRVVNGFEIVDEVIIDNSEGSPLWGLVGAAYDRLGENVPILVEVDTDLGEWEAMGAGAILSEFDEVVKALDEHGFYPRLLAIHLAQEYGPSALLLIEESGGKVMVVVPRGGV